MSSLAQSQKAIPSISAGPFTATPTGLVVQDENVPYEVWEAYGDGLRRVEGALQWVIGDWLNFGERKYGETYARALELWPEMSYQTLKACRWVAERVEMVRRRTNLSWSHHRDVAALPADEQEKWLTRAELHGWSHKELRKQMAAAKSDRVEWLRVYNVWSFGHLDARFGSGHPGNIPGQVNMNLNHYYTQPGDLVVDLFAGGGTTLDVCNYDDDAFGNRICLAYDINPTRADIQKWDVVKNGLPDFPHARLIFLDPPYWKQKRGGYGDAPTNLANMELDDFNAALEKIIKDSLQRADLVALIIGATQHGHDFVDHASEFVRRIGPPIQRIIVPYTTQQYGGAHVQRAKSGRYMLNIYRDLLIWGKL